MTQAELIADTPKFPANGDEEYLKRLTLYGVVGAAVVGAKVGAVGLAVGAGAVTHAHTID